MNKVGLSVLLAVSLIDTADSMRLSDLENNKGALDHMKEGEIVFNQNVQMKCVAGKATGNGHINLECDLS